VRGSSTGAKRGSLPCVFSKRSRTSAALSPNAWSARWQVPQVRPLVPRLWKNAPLLLILPRVLNVSMTPVGSGNPSGLYARWSLVDTGAPNETPLRAAVSANAAASALRFIGMSSLDPCDNVGCVGSLLTGNANGGRNVTNRKRRAKPDIYGSAGRCRRPSISACWPGSRDWGGLNVRRRRAAHASRP
jgi:hypothetical protein